VPRIKVGHEIHETRENYPDKTPATENTESTDDRGLASMVPQRPVCHAERPAAPIAIRIDHVRVFRGRGFVWIIFAGFVDFVAIGFSSVADPRLAPRL
jgi:hypothetical protein